MSKQQILKFPQGFLWGASTSAYQVEGNITNDWSEWEKSEARIKQLKKQGKNLEDYICGLSCNSFESFVDDLKCLKELGISSYRFSIEWSRVEPEEGKFNIQAINRYGDIIKLLKENNIEPFITLWHYPIPLWLKNLGGWESGKMEKYFCRYVEKIVSEFKNDVIFWTTLNEPDIYSGYSYLTGKFPPNKKNPLAYWRVFNNLIKVHKSVYKKIKEISPKAKIGISKHNIYFEAYKNRCVNVILKKLSDWWWNFYFLNRIKNYQDFIGLNHYRRNVINYGFNKNENKIVSDFGWEIYPKSIYFVLRDLKKYNKPIYITEHGVSDGLDKYRSWFIKESLKNIHLAISEGIDIRGYSYWSLLDNFEWAAGWTQKFGLYEVNRQTFKRTPRPSVKVYAEICKNNQVGVD
ncbi:MAG: glycoside hydrolase family 1 protein [Patescibacteria group bacterium]|jgi:beta-glucosidase